MGIINRPLFILESNLLFIPSNKQLNATVSAYQTVPLGPRLVPPARAVTTATVTVLLGTRKMVTSVTMTTVLRPLAMALQRVITMATDPTHTLRSSLHNPK